jgi:hypothetical protein
LLEKIKLELASQDKKNKFLKNLNAKYGFVLWDKASRNQSENDDKVLYFLPMAEEKNNELSAVILAGIEGDKITFNLATKSKVNQLLPISKGKENWENLPAMVLYSLKYDYEIFNLKNHEYGKWLSEYCKSKLNQVEERVYTQHIWCADVCTIWSNKDPIYPFTGENPSQNPAWVSERGYCVESTYQCLTYQVWVEECWYCGGGTTSGGTTSGSSGGSTTSSSTNTEALNKHQTLMNDPARYPDYYADFIDIDINAYLNQSTEEQRLRYLDAVTLYEAYVQNVNIRPGDPNLWQLMWETIREELGDLALDLIPVYGDIRNGYHNFSQGKFWRGCFDIATLIPVGKVGKLVSRKAEIQNARQIGAKVARVFDGLWGSAGFRKVINRLRQS